jgi:hypothetical protein
MALFAVDASDWHPTAFKGNEVELQADQVDVIGQHDVLSKHVLFCNRYHDGAARLQ